MLKMTRGVGEERVAPRGARARRGTAAARPRATPRTTRTAPGRRARGRSSTRSGRRHARRRRSCPSSISLASLRASSTGWTCVRNARPKMPSKSDSILCSIWRSIAGAGALPRVSQCKSWPPRLCGPTRAPDERPTAGHRPPERRPEPARRARAERPRAVRGPRRSDGGCPGSRGRSARRARRSRRRGGATTGEPPATARAARGLSSRTSASQAAAASAV